MRAANRGNMEHRQIVIVPNVSRYAEGSCLIKVGNTHVICTASLDNKVPMFLRGRQSGWVTAEYGMLPRATHSRMDREASKGKQSGRTHEIQRLIGRSLRACMDLSALGEMQVKIDCDVIQADGGTRTASISGGYVALALAIKKHRDSFSRNPIVEQVAAISCGMLNGELLLDMNYDEDSQADADGNFVLVSSGGIVEAQITGEKSIVSSAQLTEMINISFEGCKSIFSAQREAIKG
ncbi:ribonuclease PH [Candidatus Hydrogenosomobacter endosymbioticus]|uniref:Ribonuclease PH n=1 Tax=Candidatus Hydrogenosomobacter endosymbioticus TaxID=2558174 RepID=A0ABM7V8V2_9PROT|nr:ribonuclease PH [Candidatus Hydrogenosomobacter endosymbioticus]BDB96192.1 ribonuclease PH [Candidatus Hydrogenosomobacter endosymbioticus]